MATQEEINAFVVAEMQERAIQAKINSIKPVVPADLEKEKDAEVVEAYQAYMAVYQDHSKMTRKEYTNTAGPLIAAWKNLQVDNAAIKARNEARTIAANVTTNAEKAALEEKAMLVKESNDVTFKEITISTDILTEETAG